MCYCCFYVTPQPPCHFEEEVYTLYRDEKSLKRLLYPDDRWKIIAVATMFPAYLSVFEALEGFLAALEMTC